MDTYDGSLRDSTDFVSGRFLAINSCGYQNAPGWSMTIRKKGRKDYHILLITQGECDVYFNGSAHILRPGNMIMYFPGEEQKYIFKPGASSMWCHFSGTIVPELLDSCNISSGVYKFSVDKCVCDAFSDMIRRFRRPGKKDFANPAFLEMIYCFSSVNSKMTDGYGYNVLSGLLAYINENYNKKITLDELAAKSGYSKSRVSHLFSELTGTTPIRYQNDIRLENARELLSSTTLGVSEIAHCCGFCDPAHFSKLFKRKYKLSPANYRSGV